MIRATITEDFGTCQNNIMKRLLILLWMSAAVAAVSHAQDKTFRYLQHGSQSVWIDEDIIGDANRTGAEGAQKVMAHTRKRVAEGQMAHPFIRFHNIELWYEVEGRRRYPNNSLVSTTWYTTAWNAFVYTIEGDQDFVRWYRSLPGHGSFAIDDGSGW